jgi:EAL domain-containing protein (putative c-di-GMP-specific phosphodiesterase class I)
VALDDFGAGYTSFKNLKLLDVDMVKIDGTFVENLRRDPSDRVFIKTMAELAQTFGLETVAEWVGDDETAAILASCGITYLQGYHFGMPVPACEFDARFGGTSRGTARGALSSP